MKRSFIALGFAALVAASVAGREPVEFPKGVPPLVGIAVIGQQPADADEWTVHVSVPRVAWQVVGEVRPKESWPEIKAEVDRTELTLRQGGPSALAPSRFVDLAGQDLSREKVARLLRQQTPVWVSVSGQMPDPYYLALSRSDAVVILLGPRDGMPKTELLPAAKAK